MRSEWICRVRGSSAPSRSTSQARSRCRCEPSSRERSAEFYRALSSFDPTAAPSPPRLFSSRLYPIVLAGAIEAINDKSVDQSDHACPDGRTREGICITWFVRILSRALALVVSIVGTPAMAQVYPTRPVSHGVGHYAG